MKSRNLISYALAFGLLLPAFAVTTSGCLDRGLGPLNPCVVSGVVRRIKATNIENVDLLFMVDNSGSMAEEQAALGMQFERMMLVLASGDLDADGTGDFPPVKSLHFGVISSDMGAGQEGVTTCTMGFYGDDGLLQNTGNGPGCESTYPGDFLEFMAMGATTPQQFATDARCISTLGIGGCGFEQQLDAILKALTPSTSGITFFNNTTGHGDGENRGFLRDDSLLAIVAVTDEDDCSTPESTELFSSSSAVYTGDLNLRCWAYKEVVYPMSRYVDGLLALRPDAPDLLVYAAIVGVPADLVSDSDSINYDAILADPRMQEMPDPANPTRLTPSCTSAGGVAYPPRRMVSLAQQLEARGANGIVQSICQSDFTPALSAIIEKIADVLGGACLPRPLNPGSDGSVNCDVTEQLPARGDFTTCASLASLGREAEPIRYEVDDNGNRVEVCRVNQVVIDRTMTPRMVPAGQVGWYYDDFDPDLMTSCRETPQRISFTAGAEPKTGAIVKLECFQPARDDIGGSVAPGDSCEGGGDALCQTGEGRRATIEGMICDETSRTCQVPCQSNADCRNRLGLGGFVCDTDPERAPRAFCVNPTCQ